MQVEVKLDSAATEPRVIILTDRLTEEVNELVRRLTEAEPQMLAGFREETVTILDPQEILRIYAANGKVYAAAAAGDYLLRQRLYALEERLRPASFVRISNSELINLKKVRSFDLSFIGTICVTLLDGTTTYVSRRYVSKIKEFLGI